jgi:hypothetical protein
MSKEFSLWEKEEVITWLESLKVQQSHIDAFRRNDVTGYDLCHMTDEDLKSNLLINSQHERNRLMRNIKTSLLDLCKYIINAFS